MLNESWRRLSLLSSTCQHVAKLQFVSCAEDAIRGQQPSLVILWNLEFLLFGLGFQEFSCIEVVTNSNSFSHLVLEPTGSQPLWNLSGSMPWCSFPWHKHLPRLKQKNCCTVYSLHLIHKFTSLFRRSDFCRFAKESLPTEIGKGRHWTSVFFCGCTSSSQDSTI